MDVCGFLNRSRFVLDFANELSIVWLVAVIFLDWSQSGAPDWIRFCIGFGAVDFEAGLEWI